MSTAQLQANERTVLNLIFNEDWTDQDEFDERMDRLATYQHDVQEGLAYYYDGLPT